MISELDSRVTPEQRKTVEGIESVMQTYCDVAKGKEKTMVRCCPCRCAVPLFCPEVAKQIRAYVSGAPCVILSAHRPRAVLLHGYWRQGVGNRGRREA